MDRENEMIYNEAINQLKYNADVDEKCAIEDIERYVDFVKADVRMETAIEIFTTIRKEIQGEYEEYIPEILDQIMERYGVNVEWRFDV